MRWSSSPLDVYNTRKAAYPYSLRKFDFKMERKAAQEVKAITTFTVLQTRTGRAALGTNK